MAHRFLFTLLIIASTVGTTCHAQSVSRFGLGYGAAWLIKHHESLADAFDGIRPQAVEFTYLARTTGEKEWQQVWDFPDVGFSLAYVDMNDARLGKTWITTLFIQKYFGPRKGPFRFSFKLAPGLAVTSEVYDEYANPDNIFTSTYLNGVLEGNLLMHLQLSPSLTLYGGTTLTHYSNGGYKLPNKGVNMPALSAGLYYTPHPERYTRVYTPLSPFQRHVRFQFMFGPSMKMVSAEKRHFAWTFSSYATFHRSRKSGLTLGADIFYNNTIPVRNGPEANKYRVGTHAGHALIAGKNTLLLQWGVYVYRPEQVDTWHYWRVGLKHHFTDHMFGGINLKAHMGRADVIEWSLGYRL